VGPALIVLDIPFDCCGVYFRVENATNAFNPSFDRDDRRNTIFSSVGDG
jgi:hypothetical protein